MIWSSAFINWTWSVRESCFSLDSRLRGNDGWALGIPCDRFAPRPCCRSSWASRKGRFTLTLALSHRGRGEIPRYARNDIGGGHTPRSRFARARPFRGAKGA